jgi:hypothetical protein
MARLTPLVDPGLPKTIGRTIMRELFIAVCISAFFIGAAVWIG